MKRARSAQSTYLPTQTLTEMPKAKTSKMTAEKKVKKKLRKKAAKPQFDEELKDEIKEEDAEEKVDVDDDIKEEPSVPLRKPKSKKDKGSKTKKRKAGEPDVEVKSESGVELEHTDFLHFGLDERLVKGIGEQGWGRPTLVQDRFIPLALEGKDVVARARTGSGKTAAFAIPLVQRVLEAKEEAGTAGLRGLVLAPSKELAAQVAQHIAALTKHLSKRLSLLDLTAYQDLPTQTSLLAQLPDIVVSTPSRILAHLQGSTRLHLLRVLVVDEADLVFSLGFEKEARELVRYLPSVYQAFLTSATLSEDADQLKRLFLHNPVTLKLEEASLPGASQLSQYQITCEEEEKWVVLVALLKLSLLRGKTLIFVKDIDRCYRLKLFLQQFGLRAAVLNSFLPANARCHIVAQFNQGLYPLVIAADDSIVNDTPTTAAAEAEPKVAEGDKEEVEEAVQDPEAPAPPKAKKRKHRSDKESGVARGIDFQQVGNVVNFDFPTSVSSYVQRVGRTARGWNKGTALSLAAPEEEAALAAVAEALEEQGSEPLRPYQLRMQELDGFRYRARDVLRSVTAAAVREARLEEIKREILASRRLRGFFAANPRDLEVLRHDSSTHGVRRQAHLRHVPDYIVPETLRGSVALPRNNRKRRRLVNKTWAPPAQRRPNDPLASLDVD